jgi:hypothetical protein
MVKTNRVTRLIDSVEQFDRAILHPIDKSRKGSYEMYFSSELAAQKSHNIVNNNPGQLITASFPHSRI